MTANQSHSERSEGPDLPAPVKDHVDYAKRLVRLHRWHPDRPVGESTGLVDDARGDESLYHPSHLGRARASLTEVAAGAEQAFDLVYTAGPRALPAGTRVTFYMPGQNSLGTAPQLLDPQRPGFLKLDAPAAVDIKLFSPTPRLFSPSSGEKQGDSMADDDFVVGPVAFGFEICSGALEDEMAVTIRVGRTAGFRWSEIAGRKEFRVIVAPPGDVPHMRLPEPVVIRITPAQPERIEVVLPATCGPEDTPLATVSVRDAFDNRVPYNGTIQLDAPKAGATMAHLSEGIGRVALPSGPRDTALQLTATGDAIPGVHSSTICVPRDIASPQGLSLYIGDMHVHDFNSTAEGYPADVYQWARDEKRLDFVAVPLQVHRYLDNEKWFLAKHMAEYFLDKGRFVTFPSFEWQHSHYGDKVIHYLGGDAPYLPVDDPRYGDPAKLYAALRGTDAFIVSHHPGYALDLHVPGTNWDAVETDVDCLTELWSMHGSSEGFDPDDRPLLPPRRPRGVMEGLLNGVRMGFTAGSDTHTGRPGGSVPSVRPYWGGLCAVWARDLTRRSLFEAFKARRTYALTQSRVVLRFTVNGELMGGEIPPADTYELEAAAWAPTDIASIQFLRSTELVHEEQVDAASGTIRFSDPAASADKKKPHFYHCRVRLADGNLAVCSPVWAG